MRRVNLFIGIAIIGFTLALLNQFNSNDPQLAYSIYLLTLYIIFLLYLYDELRYYRSHNAIIASSQFVLIPAALLIISNIFAPEAWDGSVLNFSIDNSIISLHVQSTLTSTIILVPMIIFLNLMSKYYQKRYSGFVVRRKIFGPTKLPTLIHILTLVAIYVSQQQTGILDFVLFVFFLWSIVMMINYLVLPSLRGSRETTDTRARTEYMENLISRPRPQVTRPSARSDAPTTQPRRRSGEIPVTPRSGSRAISTQPTGGYRTVSPSTSRSSVSNASTTRSSTSSNSPSRANDTQSGSSALRNSAAEIDDGITMSQKPREVVANLSGKGRKYLPSGVVTKDDLKCMVCYQDFTKTSQLVSVCPYCKFPAHKDELSMWLTSSEFCPRCNKNLVSSNSQSLITIKESDYCKLRDSA